MKRSFSQYLLILARGMGMGAADIIPGVSGGTIAFITGIYEELINSIKSFNAGFIKILFKKGIKPAWEHVNGTFLTSLVLGILISIFSLARILTWLLENYALMVWAFFFGLIIGSAIHVGRKIKTWNAMSIIMLVAAAAIAYYITVATPSATPMAYWFIFISGAIAISAMVLPGISGSFILLLMGKYEVILSAVSELKISILAVFGMGVLIGVVSFANLISWLFRRFHDATLALLTGFMVGSLNKLWPWKEITETRINSHGEVVPFIERSILPSKFDAIYQADPQLWPVIGFALAGLALILVFEKSEKKKNSLKEV